MEGCCDEPLSRRWLILNEAILKKAFRSQNYEKMLLPIFPKRMMQ